MDLPNDASECEPTEEKYAGAFLLNPYRGKEKLTKAEALDAINILSGMVLLHERFEGSKG